MRSAFYVCGFMALILISSCGPSLPLEPVAQPSKDPLIVKKNGKYNLSCLFFGEKFTNAAGGSENAIEYVTLRNDKTGEEVKYEPADPAFASSRGFYTDVWSPDEEHLVLPLGRFKGFCIIDASTALIDVKQRRCADTIRVYAGNNEDSATGLWHEFQKWEGNERFSFKAGLSNDFSLLEYDIVKETLTSLGQVPSLAADNAKGKVVITPR